MTQMKRRIRGAMRRMPLVESAWQSYRTSRGASSSPSKVQPVSKPKQVEVTFGPQLATLVTVAWSESGELQVGGWVYSTGLAATAEKHPKLDIYLVGPGGKRINGKVTPVIDPEVNVSANDETIDYSGAGFIATLSPEKVIAGPANKTWRLGYRLTSGPAAVIGWFNHRQTVGSAGLPMPILAESTGGEKGWIVPAWSPKDGLVVRRSETAPEAAPIQGPALALSHFAVKHGPQHLELKGDLVADDQAPPGFAADLRLELSGPSGVFQSDPISWDGDRFTVSVPLLVSLWGHPPAPLTLGTYELRANSGDLEVPLVLTPLAAQTLPQLDFSDRQKVRLIRAEANAPRVQVRPPINDDEIGAHLKVQWEQNYIDSAPIPDGSIYFDSFYGRSATDSPRAIHDELVRRGTERTRYWVVADYSVAIPDGAVPVLMGSKAWWDVLGRASYFVHNEGTPKPLRKREDQVVVQTWHGTPLKLLGRDRLYNVDDPTAERRMGNVSKKWSYMIAGNTYSAEIFAHAYSYAGPMLDLGYPRNDSLVDIDPADIARIRSDLGIAAGHRVILYAPTWRDGDASIVGYLDLEELSHQLGPEHTILLRGHTNTLRVADRQTGANLIDVTYYPQVNELFWIADVMITDYSSVMFDYSVTGKPMIFFVPDLEDYQGRRRGMYFNLAETAPGPLTATMDDLTQALKSIEQVQEEYAERYRAWRDRFNPRDDGQASARVVDAIFGEGGH